MQRKLYPTNTQGRPKGPHTQEIIHSRWQLALRDRCQWGIQQEENSSIFDMLSSLDLHDALLHLNEADRTCTILSCSLITHYIFVSQSLLPHWVGASQLKRNLTFVSDHPSIYSMSWFGSSYGHKNLPAASKRIGGHSNRLHGIIQWYLG